jgi:RNA-directed DNA polymerase
MNPGNSEGGKAPDFWCAFDDGEDRVIGDEPGNTDKIRIFQRKLYRKSKAEHLEPLPLKTPAWTELPNDMR